MVSLLLLLLPLMGPAGSTTVVIPSHQGDLRRFEVRSGDELRHQTPPHTPRDAHGHGLPHPTSHAPAHPHSAAEHNGSGSHVPAAPAMQVSGCRLPLLDPHLFTAYAWLSGSPWQARDFRTIEGPAQKNKESS